MGNSHSRSQPPSHTQTHAHAHAPPALLLDVSGRGPPATVPQLSSPAFAPWPALLASQPRSRPPPRLSPPPPAPLVTPAPAVLRKRSWGSLLTLGCASPGACADEPDAASLHSYREYPVYPVYPLRPGSVSDSGSSTTGLYTSSSGASSSDRSSSHSRLQEKRGRSRSPSPAPAPLPAPALYALARDAGLDGAADDEAAAYRAFLKEHPQYKQTWLLDALRQSEFAARLGAETYVDYMGGAQYPDSLVAAHAAFLRQSVLGNTHSVNNTSRLSAAHAAAARRAVLDFFRAPAGYTVVFTANATAALKLVGEAFPFAQGGAYVLPADAHNSVHGVRRFAARAGARVCYVPAPPQGGVDLEEAEKILVENAPRPGGAPALFALTGQSNISNSKTPLALAARARALGYATLLDAAALAPTSAVDLSATGVDAMAVSFYKMFGWPTGVGALVVREAFLERLGRPWFAGGTVDVVQAPGEVVTMAGEAYERFEDGTINYLNLPAITEGLRFLGACLPFLPVRLSALTLHLVGALEALRHDCAPDAPVVRVLSRRPSRAARVLGEQADAGSVVALLFLDPSGEMLPNSFIEHAAARHALALRTGCMCNPGGAAALLGLQDAMARLPADATLRAFEREMRRELGVVRVSLGLASDFRDVWNVVQFARAMGRAEERAALWAEWEVARAEAAAEEGCVPCGAH